MRGNRFEQWLVALRIFNQIESAVDAVEELLTAIAHYHRTGATLGPDHTINLGRPFEPGSSLTHGLLSLPYQLSPDTASIPNPDGPHNSRLLWLIPITAREKRYLVSSGAKVLWNRIDELGWSYESLMRSSRDSFAPEV